MEKNMFYGANPMIFKIAETLRNSPTPTEELLWNYLRQNSLQVKFRIQHPAAVYVLDFYCHELKLAIEIDGSIHALQSVKQNDKERQKYLESLGITFIRFSNTEINTHLEKVLVAIEQKIKELKLNNLNKKINSPLGAGGFVIPAIDLIDGKCVRLTQGDYSQKTIYNENPLEVALQFEDAGLQRLHLVDLDGAKAGKIINWKVLETIAAKTKLTIDFGGGIKTSKDVEIVFNSGSALATVGSIAVKNEEEFTNWLTQFGAEKFLLGADVKDEKIAIHGWLETTNIWIYDFIEKYIKKGVQQIFCTDVSKDGKLEGSSIDLYKNIISKFPDLHFIASGGVATMNDLEQLKEIGCKGAIVGKAIYEGRISPKSLKGL